MDKERFNIRVYGLIMYQKKLLVTDEFRLGIPMTKFPGGGLEYGESLPDCLRRECREELGQEIEVVRHFYTTDFFQHSMYLPEARQMINVYYLAKLKSAPVFEVTEKIFDFSYTEGDQRFRWVEPFGVSPDDFTLPIDKHLAGLIEAHPENLFDPE